MSRHRRSVPQVHSGNESIEDEPPPTPNQSPEMRPRTSRGRTGSLEYSQQSSFINPSPPPRPPSSQRPKSRYRNRHETRTLSQDSGMFEQSDSGMYYDSSRPSTASSLNRYTPLPPIGFTDPADSQTKSQPVSTDKSARRKSTAEVDSSRSEKQDSAVKHSTQQSRRRKSDTASHAVQERNKDAAKGHNSSSNEVNTRKNIAKKISDVKSTDVKVDNNPNHEVHIIEEDSAESFYKPLKKKINLPPEPSDSDDKVILALKLPDGKRVQRRFRPTDKLKVVLNFAEVSAQLDFSQCDLVCNMPKKVFSDLSISIQQSGLEDRTVLHIEVPDD